MHTAYQSYAEVAEDPAATEEQPENREGNCSRETNDPDRSWLSQIDGISYKVTLC